MNINTNFIIDNLVQASFEIREMKLDPETEFWILTVVHDLHPDIETTVTLVSKDANGNDTMYLNFDGPDDYTDDEARQVLQEVLDVLVEMIEKALLEPTPNPTPDAGA